MMKKGGAPRDRRIDRRKVAMAAAAVLLLFATRVQAQNQIDYIIDSTQSWLSIDTVDYNPNAMNPSVPNPPSNRITAGFQPGNSTGQFTYASELKQTAQNPAVVNGGTVPNGSLNSPLHGHLFAAVDPGNSIQFFAQGQDNMRLTTTGNYIPGESPPGTTSPTAPPQPGEFGAKVAAIAAFLRNYNQVYDSLVSLDPATQTTPTAIPITGGNSFDVSGIVLPERQGIEDIVTGIGAGPYRIDLSGSNFPINFYSSYDPNTGNQIQGYTPESGTVDPVTLQLVIPFNFVLYNEVTVGSNRDYQVAVVGGRIVANPAPEPSTIVLFGFGVVGLLSYAWRARKRKALVA